MSRILWMIGALCWSGPALAADGGTRASSPGVRQRPAPGPEDAIPPRELREKIRQEGEAIEKAGPPPKFRWDIPEAIGKVEVPGLVEGMGTPVKLHAVRTRWKLAEIMDYMTREFARAGLYIPPTADITHLSSDPQLHAFDPQRRVGYSVIFQANRDGTTTLILGEAHLSEARPTDGNYFAPLFPGAKGVIESRQEGSSVLAYSTLAPGSEVKQFYTDVLTQRGYQVATSSQPNTVKFRKGTEQLQLTVRQSPSGASAVLLTQGPYVHEGLQDPTRPAP